MESVTVRAPSSTANLGPGFDVFGLATDAFHDTVTLRRTGRGITIVTGDDVPLDPAGNTAGVVVGHMKGRFRTAGGIEIRIKKGVPAGYGMGSSAASAAAAAVAFDRLFGLGLDGKALVECAGYGEAAAAGTIHHDNVAASVLGGFVIVRTGPLDVIRIRPPAALRICAAVPEVRVPKKKTRASRRLVPKKVPLQDCVANISNAAAMVAGFARGDPAMIGAAARDAIAEPARRGMVPGFERVRSGALRAGAAGVAISGAGPSVVAFSGEGADLGRICSAMARGFASAGLRSRTLVCRPARGARVVRGRA